MGYPEQVNLILNLGRLASRSEDETVLGLDIATLLANSLAADLAVLALPGDVPPYPLAVRAVVDHLSLLPEIEKEVREWMLEARQQAGGVLAMEKTIAGKPLSVLAIPLNRGEETTGSVLLARMGAGFSQEDRRLLETAEAQLALVMEYAQASRRLESETLALRTLLKMDRIRDSSTSMDELLDRGLAEVCRAIPSDCGYIMLYNRQGQRLELRAITDHSVLDNAEILEQLNQIADEAIHNGHLVHRSYPSGGLYTVLGLPLILNDRIIGVLGVMNNRGGHGHFSRQDRQLLHAIGSQMDTAIFERLQTQRLRQTFERSVGAQVMERLLQIDDRDLLKGERVEISALFSDIRGFTTASQQMDAGIIEEMINQHLGAMTRVALEEDGTLDKFLGDGLLALFNVPVRQEDYAMRAVQTGLRMQAAHQGIMQAWTAAERPVLPIGIGIATGVAISGNFGSPEHAEYSSIGMVVNLAARLCAVADGGEVLIDERTYQLVGERLVTEALPPKVLKGIDQPVPVWKVSGMAG